MPKITEGLVEEFKKVDRLFKILEELRNPRPDITFEEVRALEDEYRKIRATVKID